MSSQTLPSSEWPKWVLRALDNDKLRDAWERNQRLILNGNSFVYCVTPVIESQGHWAIGKIERTPRTHSEQPPVKPPKDYPKRKRRRATVIAEQDGKVLLIKERGANRYSLPGGGIEKDESFMEAAVRELREETRLVAVKTEYLFDHEGATQYHKVIWALVRGSVRIQRKELAEYKWWNKKESISMIDSTKAILDKHSHFQPQQDASSSILILIPRHLLPEAQ